MSKGFYGFLIGRKNVVKATGQDGEEADRKPKSETLLEHRKHCRAKEGNCPFEKALAREAEKEDGVIAQKSPEQLQNDSWKNYTVWKCQYNLINAFRKESANLTQDQSRLVSELGNGSVYANQFCDYMRVHDKNLNDEQKATFESLDLARKISDAAESSNKTSGYGFNAGDFRKFVDACKEIDEKKMPTEKTVAPEICVTPESVRAYIFTRLEDARFDTEFKLLKDKKYDDVLKGSSAKEGDEGNVDKRDFDKLKMVIADKLDNGKAISPKEFTDALQTYVKDNKMPEGAADNQEFYADDESGTVEYQNRFVARGGEEMDEVREFFEQFLEEIGIDDPSKCIDAREVSDGRDGTDVEVFVTVKCNLVKKKLKYPLARCMHLVL